MVRDSFSGEEESAMDDRNGADGDAIVQKCIDACSKLAGKLKSTDPFEVPHPQYVREHATDFRTRSTVGIMLNGCQIDNMVVGGPAWNSHQLEHGDEILKVDGRTVDADDILDGLVGNDLPGSTVRLTVRKDIPGNSLETVTLHRMASEVIADRRRMFELFTSIKDRAVQVHDLVIPSIVDKCIQLWASMLESDMDRQDMTRRKYGILQEQCTRIAHDVKADLRRLRNQDRRSLQGIVEEEAEARLRAERSLAALSTSFQDVDSLATQLASEVERRKRVEQGRKSVERELKQATAEAAGLRERLRTGRGSGEIGRAHV